MPQWIIYALLSMVFAGFTSVIVKQGMKDIPADLALTIRTLFVCLIIGLNFITWHPVQTIRHVSLKAWIFLAVSGLTTSLSWIFYYRAIKIGHVSTVAVIDKASIVITLALSFWLLKEPFTWRIALAGTLVLSGLLLLVWK